MQRTARHRPLAAALLALFVLLVCLPAPRASILPEFTIKQEKELGEKFKKLVKSRLPLVEDTEIKDYVRDLVNRLVRQLPPQPFAVDTNVLLDNALNAFAAPGGSVFVHTGLILNFEHESQVAGVLAHELGHVAMRHIAHRIEKQQVIGVASLIGALAGAMFGKGDSRNALVAGSLGVGQSAMLQYTREDEREADQVGMNILIKAGFRPMGFVEGFEIIQKNKWYGGSNLPAYLSTHPDVAERIEYLRNRINRLPKDLRDTPEADDRFLRVQMLLRARFADAKIAMNHFQSHPLPDGLDFLGQGIALERLNQPREAALAFERALASSPDDPLFLREAGRFHFKNGDSARAAALLQKAVIINPKDLMGLFYLARLFDEQGQSAQALTYFQRILHKLPEDAEVHQAYGRSLGHVGDYFQAHLHLAYGALYSRNRKQLHFHLDKARTLAKTGEEEEAVQEFEKKLKDREEFL